MDIRYFRHFLAVADELHFGRAATRLNMAQAPLSQSIRRLEEHLGLRLFERSRQHGTRLTDAGRVLRPEARKAVKAFDAALASARSAATQVEPPVRLGFVTLGLLERLPSAITAFEGLRPGLAVQLEEGSSAALLKGVETGRLDLALVHPVADPPRGVSLEPLRRDQVIAALPEDHPLAGRQRVNLRDLSGDALIFFPRSASPVLHDALMPVLSEAGLDKKIHQQVRSTPTMLLMVAAGLGWALVAESVRRLPFSGVSFIKLTGLPKNLTWGLDIAVSAEDCSPTAAELSRLLRG